jgi:hypothetical protein
MASGIEAEGVSRDGGVHDLRWEFFPAVFFPLLREIFLPGFLSAGICGLVARLFCILYFVFFFTKSYSSEKISCAL